MGVSKNPLVDT